MEIRVIITDEPHAPPQSLIMHVPGRFRRDVNPEELRLIVAEFLERFFAASGYEDTPKEEPDR